MDPDFLKNLEYFATPNNQTSTNPDQAGESSTAAATRNETDAAFWDALARGEPSLTGPSSNPPSASVPSFAQSSTAPTNLSYRPVPGQANNKRPGPGLSRTTQNTASPRRKEGHEKKRTKMDPDAAALESVDYWIQFDDDDADNNLGGSFEIDFSKRPSNPSHFGRPPARLNPLPTTPGLGTGLYANPTFREDDFLDDGALDNALSAASRGTLLNTIELGETSPRPGSANNIASGFGFGMGGDIGSEYSSMGHMGSSAATASLSEISKAAGDEPTKSKGKGKEKEGEAPKPAKQTKAQKAQAAKAAAAAEAANEKGKLGDRTAHNDIERKYRTNLKDKIAELRDAVPSLKSMPDEGDEDDDDSQTRGAPKVSKGTVLLKATEYIHHLEKRNQAIMKEHQELARRLQAFEQLLTATARQPFPMPTYSRTMFDPRGFC
ncbi:Sterol regulatory element-binding protein 1 like [Verticillium longisporum]|uniref:Sterol regulatory element-binding protein 1 like n=1 Tax=Verticillium longisporum TaxID=100787 RepID=A0A8I2ZRA2_VERLO|nr:Sterol regulatory element-binding protein 1 like [Verticillium longisporum]